MYEVHDELPLPSSDPEGGGVSLGLKRQSSAGACHTRVVQVVHEDPKDSPVSVGQRRRVVIRRSNTLQPRGGHQNVAHRFDVTRSAGNSKVGLHNEDPDLQIMVRGRVASVSSRVAAESIATPSIRFAKSPRSSIACDPIKFKSRSEAAAASIKMRLTNFWWWLLNQCLSCARHAHLTSRTTNFPAKMGTNGHTSFEVQEGGLAGADEENGGKDYWGPLIGHGDNGHAAKPLFTSFKTEGRVTTSCLWHACRAVTVGCLLIIMGITMAILGFIADQNDYVARVKNQTHASHFSVGPGMAEPVERFRLNNLSFAGPVIMGVGGFLIVAACVMTFEARDSAAKVVPATTANHNDDVQMGPLKAQFRSSSSQTTLLDRNIVHNLASTTPAPVQTSSSKLSSVGGRTTTTVCTQGGCGPRKRRPRTVPASYTSGSGSVKRASFSGTLPDVAGIEPGLALMDEIGRRALTDAFIRFTKETAKTHRFLYNNLGSSRKRSTTEEEEEDEDDLNTGMQKCPSAPNIHQHKLYPVPSMMVTPASQEGMTHGIRKDLIFSKSESSSSRPPSASRVKLSLSLLPPIGPNEAEQQEKSYSTYRVLTPTMYRSRMACARQTVSMDYDDDSGAVKKARLRREGPSMRGPSPLLRPGKLLMAQRSSGENSLDLELGASATRVHQLPSTVGSSSSSTRIRRLSPNVHHHHSLDHSGSTMMLDLHIEGAAPVTLLVRDESRSTRSTSVNKDEDLDLDFPSCDSSMSSKRPRLLGNCHHHNPQQQPPTSSDDEAAGDLSRSKLHTVVDECEAAATNLSMAEEMASFEFIDELAASAATTSSSSMASDFDVWSPREAAASASNAHQAVTSNFKSRFLSELEAKSWLALPARRASAESLSTPLSPKNDLEKMPASVSVTLELNRLAATTPTETPQPAPTNGNNAGFQSRRRNCQTRQSKLVRQSKVDDHRDVHDDKP